MWHNFASGKDSGFYCAFDSRNCYYKLCTYILTITAFTNHFETWWRVMINHLVFTLALKSILALFTQPVNQNAVFKERTVQFGLLSSTHLCAGRLFLAWLCGPCSCSKKIVKKPRQIFNHYSTGLPWVQSWENFLSLKLWHFHTALSPFRRHPSWPFVLTVCALLYSAQHKCADGLWTLN